MIRDGAISSRELLAAFENRYERLNPIINAVATADFESAHAAAAAADNCRASSRAPLGVLHGLPVTIKDALAVAGMRSTSGAPELGDYVPANDAAAVSALRRAGAIIFAKTNTPAWAGDIQTHNTLFGTTNNPWNTGRTAGGSSGGSAAAVSAGLTALDIGTDLGGSIRIPSGFCGIFGLKPTFGAVAQDGYLDCSERRSGYAVEVDMNSVGPLARSASDLHLVMTVLATTFAKLSPVQVESVRIGVCVDDAYCQVVDGVASTILAAARSLDSNRIAVQECSLPVSMADVGRLCNALTLSAVSASVPYPVGSRIGGTHRDWLQNNDERSRLRTTWSHWFTSFDALVCPIMSGVAFSHSVDTSLGELTLMVDDHEIPATRGLAWCQLASLSYLPSVAVPVGLLDGMPVGAQIICPYGGDSMCLWIARKFEEAGFVFINPPVDV